MIEGIKVDVIRTILSRADSLPEVLKSTMNNLRKRLVATYYWKSAGYLYEKK
jgi:hypothetical protein